MRLARNAGARVLHLSLNGVHHVIGGEFDAIAPKDPVAQLHRHLREVGIVGRFIASQGIVPYAIDAGIGVDVPQRIHAKLLQPVGIATVVHHPNVEPCRIGDPTLRIFGDQNFVSRYTSKKICLCECIRG